MTSRRMRASEFKAKCLGVLDEIARTGETLTITKRGKAVAYVSRIPPTTGAPGGLLGCMQGTLAIVGDIVSPSTADDDWDANH